MAQWVRAEPSLEPRSVWLRLPGFRLLIEVRVLIGEATRQKAGSDCWRWGAWMRLEHRPGRNRVEKTSTRSSHPCQVSWVCPVGSHSIFRTSRLKMGLLNVGIQVALCYPGPAWEGLSLMGSGICKVPGKLGLEERPPWLSSPMPFWFIVFDNY